MTSDGLRDDREALVDAITTAMWDDDEMGEPISGGELLMYRRHARVALSVVVAALNTPELREAVEEVARDARHGMWPDVRVARDVIELVTARLTPTEGAQQ